MNKNNVSKTKICYLKLPDIVIQQSKDLERFCNKTIKNGEFICDSDVPQVKRYFADKSLKVLDETGRGLLDVIIPILEEDMEVIQRMIAEWKKKIDEVKTILSKNIEE